MASEIQGSKQREKRVVVHVVTGQLSGLRRIIGRVFITPDHHYPPSIPYLDGEAQHAGTFERYVLYREFKLAAKGKFNEFNPAQI